jgi:hypothetical protein
MNLLPNRPVQSEPIDGLLQAFYRKQMPRPWPAAPLPPARPVPFPASPRQSGVIRRRLALAASVALLALGSLLVGGKAVPNRPSGTPGIGSLPPGSAHRDVLPPGDSQPVREHNAKKK